MTGGLRPDRVLLSNLAVDEAVSSPNVAKRRKKG